IAHISSRLIVNKAAMKMKYDRIQPFIEAIRQAIMESS
ncbi:MAG TPA: ATP phosphoribosyltransferase, partial [Gammaproteobacteria bacterium]|nr:ATP phosphoribosyltransferase [Gammaproteobacteria bacterium]